jgi:hypothetical protein
MNVWRRRIRCGWAPDGSAMAAPFCCETETLSQDLFAPLPTLCDISGTLKQYGHHLGGRFRRRQILHLSKTAGLGLGGNEVDAVL